MTEPQLEKVNLAGAVEIDCCASTQRLFLIASIASFADSGLVSPGKQKQGHGGYPEGSRAWVRVGGRGIEYWRTWVTGLMTYLHTGKPRTAH